MLFLLPLSVSAISTSCNVQQAWVSESCPHVSPAAPVQFAWRGGGVTGGVLLLIFLDCQVLPAIAAWDTIAGLNPSFESACKILVTSDWLP